MTRLALYYKIKLMKTPSEHFKLAVIGRVKTKSLQLTCTSQNGTKTTQDMPGEEYDVIEIGSMNDKKVYVTNHWIKEYKKEPLYLLEELVESFTPSEK